VAGGRLLPTVASKAVRERNNRTLIIASVAGAIVAAFLAWGIVLAFSRPAPAPTDTSAEPAPSPTPVPMMPPEPSTPSTAVAPTPTTTAAPKPTSSVHTRPSAKPTSTFAAPDRTFRDAGRRSPRRRPSARRAPLGRVGAAAAASQRTRRGERAFPDRPQVLRRA